MKHLVLALVAVLSAACNALQESPVAPSAVLPAAPSVGPRLPTYTAFDVTLSNGTTYAIADSPWLGFLSIQPHEGALITTPARVSIDCGNGTVTDVTPGTGFAQRFTCRWMTPGDVVVRATVESQHGVTTSASLPLHVEPPIVVEEPVSVSLAVAQNAGASTADMQAWTFTPTTTGRVMSLRWDFGDGQTLTTGPNQVLTHWYRANGVYTITAIPVLENGSTRAGAHEEIVVNGL